MANRKPTSFRYGLLLCLAGFGLGTALGGITLRDWQKALKIGIISAPVVCGGGLLMRSGKDGEESPESQVSSGISDSSPPVESDYEQEQPLISQDPEAEALEEAIAPGIEQEQPLISQDPEAEALEEAIAPGNEKATPEPVEPQPQAPAKLSFDAGVQCLLAVLQEAAQADKPQIVLSQLNVLMGQHPEFAYQSCASVYQPDGESTFKKFKEFVQAIEATGKIQIFEKNSGLYAGLTSDFSYSQAAQCVLHTLALNQQENGDEEPQEINITHLHLLVKQHLNFDYFAKTRIWRPDGQQYYGKLSKFLEDVAKTGQIQLRRGKRGIFIKLMELPSEPIPESLVAVLAALQAQKAAGELQELEIGQAHLEEEGDRPSHPQAA